MGLQSSMQFPCLPNKRQRKLVAIWALAAGTLAAVGSARAQAGADAAEQAFNEGVKLMAQGKCDQAPAPSDPCDRARQLFDDAFRLNADGLGALRNRAFIEKAHGLVVKARASFRELAQRAKAHSRPERQAWAPLALAEVARLDTQVAYLTLDLPLTLPDDFVATLNGLPVERALWGKPLGQDPGTYEVKVARGTEVPLRRQIQLSPGQNSTVSPLVSVPAVLTPAVAAEPSSSNALAPSTWLIGAGGVSVAVGLGFGVAAFVKHTDVCDSDNVCEASGLSDGKRLAQASNWFVGAGGLAVAGGLLWRWWGGGRESEPQQVVRVYPALLPEGIALTMAGTL